ncbi:palmitoyl-CoA hydrolase [Xylogone sp. PMI_703]|nr:palmitoyl-CoA hydrolase [Xylogone sp. PMI_703]
MVTSKFEESLRLKKIAEDTFVNVERTYSFPNGNYIPGSVMLPQCALAAYMTLPPHPHFYLHCLQSHFISVGIPSEPVTYKVNRIKTSLSTAIRVINAMQNDLLIMFSTASFTTKRNAPVLTHSAVPEFELYESERGFTNDEMQNYRTTNGPFWKWQILPTARQKNVPTPSSDCVRALLQFEPFLEPLSYPQPEIIHILGILQLSDISILDASIGVHGFAFGLSSFRRWRPLPKVYTTMNHTVHFYLHEGFRADEPVYGEMRSPWARDGRVLAQSRLFTADSNSRLIATCTQEGLVILSKEPPPISKL